MHFEFGLRSSLLLIFFTHLLVYSFLFGKRGARQADYADRLLGAYLLLAALFIFPWMAGFAGWYDTQPYREFLFYMPFLHPLFFGPLLYLYLKCLTNSHYRLQPKDYYHFIPGVLYLLWSAFVAVADKLIFKRYILFNGRTDPDFDTWYSCLWCVSLIIYLFISIRYYRQYRSFTYFEFSFADAASMRWLRNFLYVFALLTLLLLSEQVLSFFVNLAYIRAWYYFFAFALLNYYMAISAYSARVLPIVKFNFEPQRLLQYQQALQLQGPPAEETVDVPYELLQHQPENDWMQSWKDKIEQEVKDGKLYLEPELTLSELAKRLGSNPSLISKVINSSFQLNFNDYINQYRVQEAIRLMADPRYRNLNLLAIAYDAGFNSKSTFNRAFKKVTGSIPKDYLQQSAL